MHVYRRLSRGVGGWPKSPFLFKRPPKKLIYQKYSPKVQNAFLLSCHEQIFSIWGHLGLRRDLKWFCLIIFEIQASQSLTWESGPPCVYLPMRKHYFQRLFHVFRLHSTVKQYRRFNYIGGILNLRKIITLWEEGDCALGKHIQFHLDERFWYPMGILRFMAVSWNLAEKFEFSWLMQRLLAERC